MSSNKSHKIKFRFGAKLLGIFYLVFIILSNETKSQSIVSLSVIPINDVKNEDFIFLIDSLENYFRVNAKLGNKNKYSDFKELMLKDIIHARPLLDSLEENFKVKDSKKIIFLTNKKLSPSKMPPITGSMNELQYLIRGLASKIPGNYGIVSTYKLRKEADNNLHFKHLLVKTTRHEFAHLLGLHHCSNKKCLMKSGYDPVIFQSIDYKLCEKCQELLRKSN